VLATCVVDVTAAVTCAPESLAAAPPVAVSAALAEDPAGGMLLLAVAGDEADACVAVAALLSGDGSTGGTVATGSLPPSSVSALYCDCVRSAAREFATCFCSSGVDGGVGLDGMLARSGVLPPPGGCDVSAVLLWSAVALALVSLSPNHPLGSTQSGMLEQPPRREASKTGAAKRANAFALAFKFLNMGPSDRGLAPSRPGRDDHIAAPVRASKRITRAQPMKG
jgi:hypothetical protein